MNCTGRFHSAVKNWFINKPCDRCYVSIQDCWDRFKCPEYEIWYKEKPEIKRKEV